MEYLLLNVVVIYRHRAVIQITWQRAPAFQTVIMPRILPLADDVILPQTRQEIYFLNRIDPTLPVANWLPRSKRQSCRLVKVRGELIPYATELPMMQTDDVDPARQARCISYLSTGKAVNSLGGQLPLNAQPLLS